MPIIKTTRIKTYDYRWLCVPILLILDGNSENVAHALKGETNYDLWLVPI